MINRAGAVFPICDRAFSGILDRIEENFWYKLTNQTDEQSAELSNKQKIAKKGEKYHYHKLTKNVLVV